MPRSRLHAARLAVAAVGCALLLGAAPADDRDAKPKEPVDPTLFTGVLVPANATDLFAPEFVFKVSGWNSSWGWRKIVELVPDGKPVKKGDIVVRFEWSAKDALDWITKKVQQAEAEAAERRISGEQALDSLRIEKRRRELEARLAEINTERERAVSRRQADLYKLGLKLAEFEVDAAGQRFDAAKKANDAERAYQEKAVARAKEDLDRFHYFEHRFELRAPHDGLVRHVFNPRERRKFQKGDGCDSGRRVASVARDPQLVVRFYVPEHRVAELAQGSKVVVSSLASGEEHAALVERVDFFPQELGSLMENEDLPNAREKYFSVTAKFEKDPPGLAAGNEVRVRSSK